ncbi:hypothetical protein Vadar_026854 [Vaccinium darrowii]|uniref:Uncharacterized protein n=1 Tax=Vaccinium darrowii TaxID=229202 RepID=A0ACB7Y8Z3_9ERIC|nr:hypothetical protein Vadar_026854 [Vaccinium darrowii]
MASSLALKKLVSSNLLPKSLLSTRQALPAAQSASRLFNTFTKAVRDFDDDDRCRCLNAAGKLASETFSGLDHHFYVRETARETEDCLYLRMAMPGFRKETVKIVVERNTLTIEGKTAEESGEVDIGDRYYSNSIDLADNVYRTDQIKAKLKNGVLKVVVPKAKEEERSDEAKDHVAIEYKNS